MVALAAILKNTVIISDIRTGIEMLPQPRALIHNDYQSMVGECHRHPDIEPAAAPANFTEKTHSVTSDFLSPQLFLSGRSKVVGDRIYCNF